MKLYPRIRFVGIAGSLGLFFTFIASPSLAQAQENDATTSETSEEVIELSPFEVTANEEVGYLSTATLAGTRIKTELRDVAASVSVYTKEFLDDLGAKNAVDLLTHTTGTEVAGLGGNLTNASSTGFSLDFSVERFSLTSTTRVRGLAGADNTKDYYRTIIPLDSYNIERVTINRGANNILFGLGSPAGILDRTLSRPGGNQTTLQLRFDEFGSARTELDVSKVLIEGKLDARLIGMLDRTKYKQNATFEDKNRIYGAVDYKPFKNTRIRMNFEAGDSDGSPPNLAPPSDKLTTFWTFGQVTKPPYSNGNGAPTFDLMNAVPPLAPSIVFADRAVSSDYGFMAYLLGGGIKGPIITPEDPLFDLVNPDVHNNYRPGMVGMEGLSRYNRNTLGNLYAAYLQEPQVLDRSIFDYEKESLTGNNDRRFNDFTAYNIALQQGFFDNLVGFEVAYDKQAVNNGNINFSGAGWRQRFLGIDVTPLLQDGSPNPGFGRAFTTSGPRWAENEQEFETFRFTGYAKFIGEDHFDKIGKWLGDHTLTLLVEESNYQRYSSQGQMMMMDKSFTDAVGLSGGNVQVLQALRAGTIHYLSPDSLLGNASAAGAQIQGMPSNFVYPTETTLTYPDPVSRTWQTQTFPVHTYYSDKKYTTFLADKIKDNTQSIALAWQAKWFDTVVGTFGWRRDAFKQYDAGAAPAYNDVKSVDLYAEGYDFPDDPGIDLEDDTFSYGLVLHTPKYVKQFLPKYLDLSLHYNNSENFRPSAVTENPYGGYYAPQGGENTEYGFTVSVNEKVSIKFNWFETSQTNLAENRLTTPYYFFFMTGPRQVYAGNTLDEIEAAGYPLPDPRIQETFGWDLIPNGDGTHYLDNQNQVLPRDVSSAVSDGLEIEIVGQITPAWRVSMNVVQQRAVKSGIAATAKDEILRLYEGIQNMPVDLRGETSNSIKRLADQQFTTFETVLVEEGLSTSELVEWSANLVTNYSFREGKLKGLGIGAALKWQEAPTIGYEIAGDPAAGEALYLDVNRPVFGDETLFTNVWFSYRLGIFKDIDCRIQLNINNVFDAHKLVKVYDNPTEAFTVGEDSDVYRLNEGRKIFVTLDFTF